MEHVRVIKKYPNRRLYDTYESRYIALRDIRHLVQTGVDIMVVDNRTKKETTLGVLLQIIAEQEQKKQATLTAPLLHNLIRNYAEQDCKLIGAYLEQSLQLLVQYKQQAKTEKSKPFNKRTLDKLVLLQDTTLQSFSDTN